MGPGPGFFSGLVSHVFPTTAISKPSLDFLLGEGNLSFAINQLTFDSDLDQTVLTRLWQYVGEFGFP